MRGLPYMGSGLEVYGISKIGHLAAEKGYDTLFIQSSKRGSFRMDAIAKSVGFAEVYGMEDVPVIYPYDDPTPPVFGWDYDTLMFLKKKLDEKNKPFLAYFFSGTTHTPFRLANKKFEKYPHDAHGYGGLYNTLAYADWSLGEFFAEAGKSPWFNNTVFILMADHPYGRQDHDTVFKQYHIPMVVYSPGNIAPRKTERVVSQLDVMPTLASLMHIEKPVAVIGTNLLEKKGNGVALINRGNLFGAIGNGSYILHDGKTRLASSGTPETLQKIENRMLATEQVVVELLQTNRLTR